jgi:hypothetical protein
LDLNHQKAGADKGFFTQATLIFESVFVLLLGILAGVLMPESMIAGIRRVLAESPLSFQPGYLKYILLLLAVFVIFHQYFCWMWLVRFSNKVFSRKNWGTIYFTYTCIGLFIFSICFGLLQIVFMA